MVQKKTRQPAAALVIGVLGLAYFLSNFHRLSLGVIGTDVAASLDLTKAQLGALGSAYFYSYAIMQLPCGALTDRFGSKPLVIASCLMMTISSVWFALAESFVSLTLSRVMTGMATALVYIPSLCLLRETFGDKVYGSLTGIFVSIGHVGAACAAYPLRFAADLAGWRTTSLILGILPVGIAALVLFFIQWHRPVPAGGTAEPAQKEKSSWGQLLKPWCLALTVWFFVAGGVRLSFQSLWGGQFFETALGKTPAQSSLLLMCVSLSGIVGPTVLGALSDRIGSVKTALAGSLVFMLCWPVMNLFTENASMVALCVVMCIMGFSGVGSFTVGYSVVRSFADKRDTGKITGINSFAAFISSALFTQFTGQLMDGFGGTPLENFHLLFWIFAGLVLLSVLILGLGTRKKMNK